MENKISSPCDGVSGQHPCPAGCSPTDEDYDSSTSSLDFPKYDMTPSRPRDRTKYNPLEEAELVESRSSSPCGGGNWQYLYPDVDIPADEDCDIPKSSSDVAPSQSRERTEYNTLEKAELMENKSSSPCDGGSWQHPYAAGCAPTDEDCVSHESSFDIPKFDVTPCRTRDRSAYNSSEEAELVENRSSHPFYGGNCHHPYPDVDIPIDEDCVSDANPSPSHERTEYNPLEEAELMENKSSSLCDGGSSQNSYAAGCPPTDEDCVSYENSFDIPKFDLTPHRPRDSTEYDSLEEFTEALRQEGLGSFKLIIGIDFSTNNELQGMSSFNGQSLHHIGSGINPFEQAITAISKTLAAFDDDNLIPCFGFGDASTKDQDVFSFHPDGRYCHGFDEVVSCYRKLIPYLELAGPTSFAPIIEMAMNVVEQNGDQYHVLAIIAGGQATRSVDTEDGQLTPQEQKTVQAIVKTSMFPLSIILVGVGDGPWDMVKKFYDNIPARLIKHFQFVNLTEIMAKNVDQTQKEVEFAQSALKEIPSQYQKNIMRDMFSLGKDKIPKRVELLPPPFNGAASGGSFETYWANTFWHSSSSYNSHYVPAAAAPSTSVSTYGEEMCPACYVDPKDMAFGCGHRTCRKCGEKIKKCPMCRAPIETRIKLY